MLVIQHWTAENGISLFQAAPYQPAPSSSLATVTNTTALLSQAPACTPPLTAPAFAAALPQPQHLVCWVDGCAGQFKGCPAVLVHHQLACQLGVSLMWCYRATAHFPEPPQLKKAGY